MRFARGRETTYKSEWFFGSTLSSQSRQEKAQEPATGSGVATSVAEEREADVNGHLENMEQQTYFTETNQALIRKYSMDSTIHDQKAMST